MLTIQFIIYCIERYYFTIHSHKILLVANNYLSISIIPLLYILKIILLYV